jgi:hypothetical protein
LPRSKKDEVIQSPYIEDIRERFGLASKYIRMTSTLTGIIYENYSNASLKLLLLLAMNQAVVKAIISTRLLVQLIILAIIVLLSMN